MHYLQLFFRDRLNPIYVPVAEDDRALLNDVQDRAEPLGFVQLGSIVDHNIWLNGGRLQIARLLLEMDAAPFTVDALKPSMQYPENEEDEPDLFEVRWQVSFWIRGRSAPISVHELSGHDWVEIYTSCDCAEQFLTVTDEDGEELVVCVPDVDMVCGLEVDRYSDAQREVAATLIRYEPA